MTIEELDRANKLNEEIKELKNFLFTSNRVWKGSLTKEVEITKYIFRTIPYGSFDSVEYNLDKQAMEEVQDVLERRLERLEEQLERIGKA